MRYNPALDGLRAVAIILVLLVHGYQLPGGWIGVDIFFVLSGYLITSILLREMRETGNIALGNFYFRRAVRLSPPFLLLGAAVFVHSLFSSHGVEMRAATWPALLYLQNWVSPLHLGSPDSTMWHTWSLATEEQFYLLWPLTLPLIAASKRPAVWIAALVAAMTLIRVGLWDTGASEWFLSQSLIGRPVGLLVGCGLAFLPIRDLRASFPMQGALLGSLLVLSTFASVGAVWPPLTVSLLTAGLIACLQGPSFLAIAPLRYIGRISYGLYLYHWPIIVAGKGHAPMAILIGLSLVAAALSYEFVEKPFLRLKERRIIFSPAASAA